MSDGAREYSAWIGRSEDAGDRVSAGALDRLRATLDHADPPAADGDLLPPLAHWLCFLPGAAQSALGPDGHPRRGGFLPPVALPRRMWAGSRVSFPGDVRVGDDIVRRSVISSVTEKSGASGKLVFVVVRHEIGRPGEAPAIVDEHDIVYRAPAQPGTQPAPKAVEPGTWRRTLTPDPVLLFRYSALTFNGHRIHYDRAYATQEEGYPGLVVHGPLIATLLIDLVHRHAPSARVERFSFRAVAPLFDGVAMSVNATPPGADGLVKLWAANAEGGLAMSAEAKLA
jgi:3-methylfumaryl-CoA hydratase